MRKDEVRTPEQALAYITDCNMATVSDMAMKKSRPKGEYQRQISIAQTAVDWIKDMGIDHIGTRMDDLDVEFGTLTVEVWAKYYEPR